MRDFETRTAAAAEAEATAVDIYERSFPTHGNLQTPPKSTEGDSLIPDTPVKHKLNKPELTSLSHTTIVKPDVEGN